MRAFLALLKDEKARARLVTWQPVIYTLVALIAVLWLVFFKFPQADSNASKAHVAASQAKASAHQQCVDTQQARLDSNRDLRRPLHRFAEKQAAAATGLATFIASLPQNPKASKADKENLARFIAGFVDLSLAAQELEAVPLLSGPACTG